MKRNGIIAALLLLLAQSANALLVSVEGYGEIPDEGLQISVTEAEENPFTGEMVMELNGNLLCNDSLTVTITRSEEGLIDEFCCADQCRYGNEEKEEVMKFAPNGLASWFIHYSPLASSDVAIIYEFSDGTESYTLYVRFDYRAEGIENTSAEDRRQGIYTLTGTRVQSEDVTSLPTGIYITPEKKIIKQ